MFSLPSLAPQDSYFLLYASSTAHPSNLNEPAAQSDLNPTPSTQNATVQNLRRHAAPHRSPLARLRQDEEYMERRKINIQNYGNSWLKPPGVPKTLYQQREERREMEEHQEALRREQLAQELAEAEAEAGMDTMLQGEGMDEEARDLDDDIPEADNTGLSLGDDDDDDVDDDDDDDDEDDEDAENEQSGEPPLQPVRAMITEMRARAAAAAAARIPTRVPNDVYREALARGENPEAGGFGDDGVSTADEEAQDQMLQEEDLLQDESQHPGDFDMDMNADLDAEIPDADEATGYEHTDTEAELSSSEDESVDADFLPARSHAATTSMIRSDGTQNSMDLSSLISGGGSSQIGSSPRVSGILGRRK